VFPDIIIPGVLEPASYPKIALFPSHVAPPSLIVILPLPKSEVSISEALSLPSICVL
jgi:hypothetical protein